MTDEMALPRSDSSLPPVYDIFVGYAGPDHALAERLVNLLHGRVAVWWGRFLAPDESFDSAIPEILRNSRVLTILVSTHTWDGHTYASEELAIAIALARQLKTRILPLWIEDIAPEKRPYGIVTTVRLSLASHNDCMGCIASKLVEVVLRARAVDAERLLALAAQRNMPNIEPDNTRTGLPDQTATQRVAANERDPIRRE
jgi:hypothetical protein